MDEFFIIDKFFKRNSIIGDDAAIVNIQANKDLVVSVDTMVEGVHFLKNDNPHGLGHKLLAVNLSDMAAMGAKPKFITLAISMPSVDEVWLEAFTKGMFKLADKHQVTLIGGDTTKAKNYILSMQIIGQVPSGLAIKRNGAIIDDDVYESGRLGASDLAVAIKLNELEFSSDKAIQKLEYPQPRVELGLKLRAVANSMIDISDGLLQDLQHILDMSGVGAKLDADKIPLAGELDNLDESHKFNYALNGGEDYELLFTAKPEMADTIKINKNGFKHF
jgi:thiamine-monophosphate kinase